MRDYVQVNTEACEYNGLVGRVVEITQFNDSGMIEFTEAELNRARRPDRVLCACRRVHFYWRELQQVIYD
jgi:pyridoxine/pyridoxamine 5'-phosphate oxidase